MSHRLLATALLLAAPTGVAAAERTVYVAGFDKLRVQGPFEVRVTTGHTPAATVAGAAGAIDGVEVQVEGTTLVVRSAARRWEQQPRIAAPAAPAIVTLATQTLVSASVLGAGRLSIGRMKGDRLDLSVTGAGAITVGEIAADAANATVIGNGALTLAGRAGKVRLMTNGAGTIDAGALEAGDLVVRLDGPGATMARARFTASIVNAGLGQVTVAGQPKCTVKADAGGPVVCGAVR